MKSMIPIVVICLLVLSGIGVVADTEPEKSTEIVSVSGGVGHLFVEIENTGEAPLNNLEYNLVVKGGLLGKIGVKESGIISFIDYQATEVSVSNEPIMGFGKVCITVSADYADPWQGTGFVVGPIILVLDTF